MRRAHSTSHTTWPLTVAAFLLGFIAVFRWQQWQDARLLRQMEQPNDATLPATNASAPTPEDDR